MSSSSWILDGNQAGLSWRTVLYEREDFRAAFDQFDVNKVARYDGTKVAAPHGTNKRSRPRSARAFLTIQAQRG